MSILSMTPSFIYNVQCLSRNILISWGLKINIQSTNMSTHYTKCTSKLAQIFNQQFELNSCQTFNLPAYYIHLLTMKTIEKCALKEAIER